METKFLKIEVKADSTAGSRKISGYGSIFGNRDLGGDVVQPGAFAASIASGRVPKMLWQHDADDVIGVWTSIVEDGVGLKLEGELADTNKGNDVYKLLKMGALDGLSIGYFVTDEAWDGSTRLIKGAELWEVSVVTFPMNESAKIDSVKAAEMTEREIERKLTQDAGFSRSVARALMSGGYDAVKGMRDAAEAERELVELLLARAKM